jgi:chromosome segregation ATPase
MSNRDEYVEKLKAQLDHWTSQLVKWENAALDATAEARIELERQVGIMRSRADDLAYRTELLKGASSDAWHEIARGADEACKTLQEAFDKACLRFKDL